MFTFNHDIPEANNMDEKIESTNVEHRVTPLEYTDDEVKVIIRKLDWHIIPLCFVLYTFSVLDRSNLGNARLAGLETDLNLDSKRYAWLGTWYVAFHHLRQQHNPPGDR